MSAKHTPGPWPLVKTPHEQILAGWHIQIGERQVSIFPYKRIYSDDGTQSGFVTDHEHMADARLIAAAPELLEALLNVARMAEALKRPCGMDPESPQAIRNGEYMNISYAARAAIAKATGEQP